MRIVSLFLLGGLVALSFVIYEVKYDTREMDGRVAALRLEIQKERDAIAILRAEWSHLNRPERIERLARKHLGLGPLQARQIITIDQLAALRDKTTRQAPGGPVSSIPAPELRHPVRAVR